MKKIISPLILLAMLLSAGSASACVGRILTIGVSQTSSDLLLAEIVSVLVNERTGTNVKVLQFRDTRDLYAAVRKGEVGLVVEHAERGLEAVGHAKEGNPKISYETAKKEYRKAFNMVWLDPVGLSSYYAPVVTVDTMSNLPALPKLLNKLSGVLNDETFGRLVKQAKGDDKPRRVARDFLKSKKLI